MHVRVLGRLRAADTADPKAATRQLATDGAAEEPGGPRDHCQRPRGGRRRDRAGDGHGLRGVPDVRGELLVDRGDAPQVIGTEGRTAPGGGAGVELRQKFHEPRIVGAAHEPLGEAYRAAPGELGGLEEGVGDLLDGARALIRRPHHDRADEIGRQRPARAGDGQRRGHGSRPQADAETAHHLARPQQRVQHRRGGARVEDLDRGLRRPETLEGGDEGVQRMGKDVQQLVTERATTRALGIEPGRAKRKVAVDERDGLQLRGALQQPAEGGVADQLVPGADEEPTLARQLDQGVRFDLRLDERFFDVDMGPGEQRLSGRLEVRAGGRADVHDIRPRLREHRGEGIVGLGHGAPGERLCRLGPHVIHADHAVRGRDAAQRGEMQPGHVPGADERDAQRSGAAHPRHPAVVGCATTVTANSLTPRSALARARSADHASWSRFASAWDSVSTCTGLKS